jgi:hypothetical protein
MSTNSHKPVIEVYADPSGVYGGKNGCWRARLATQPALHDAGDTIDHAVSNLLLNLPRFDRSGELAHYKIELIMGVNS